MSELEPELHEVVIGGLVRVAEEGEVGRGHLVVGALKDRDL